MIKLKDILHEKAASEIVNKPKSNNKGKLSENRPAWMAAAMVGKIIFKIIYVWAKENPKKIQRLKDFVRKLDPTKPFRTP